MDNHLTEMTAEDTAFLDTLRKGESAPVADEPPADPDIEHGDEAGVTDAPPIEAEEPAPKPKIKAKVPEEKAEPEAKDKPPAGFVPHGAFHEEREGRKAEEAARKAAEARIAEFEAKIAALEARLPKQEEPTAEEPDMPDPVTHPDEFKAWLKAQRQAPMERVQKFEEQQSAEKARLARLSTAATLERQFMAETPDYADAVAHLHTARVAELQAYGFGEQPMRLPDGREVPSIAQIIASDAQTLFDNAQRLGKNPAAMLYEMAKLRGWSAQAPEPEVAKTDPTVSEAARLLALSKAQKNNQTLSTAAGEGVKGSLTATQLAKMSEEDFAKLSKDDLRKVLGG